MRRPGDGAPTARPRILVVDDDDGLCDAIRDILHDDYAVASVPHGAAALELVRAHEPVLILLDLRMPVMDGWSFVENYRRTAVAPAAIVLMSGDPDLASIATQLGADGHLTKPFDLDALHAFVAAHVLGHAAGVPQVAAVRADQASSQPLT